MKRFVHVQITGATSAGAVMTVDQDSYCVAQAATLAGEVAMAVVADGMGGLPRGELASATVVRVFSDWFAQELPQIAPLLATDASRFESTVEWHWRGLAKHLNEHINTYAAGQGIQMGSTLTAVLLFGNRYLAVHVGDTRLYEISVVETRQLTEDDTFVHHEIAEGRMTPEEAAQSPYRNALLQCVGASEDMVPTIIHGNINQRAGYLLCSDGFRHQLTASDLRTCILPSAAPYIAKTLFSLCEERGERDNMTAVIISPAPQLPDQRATDPREPFVLIRNEVAVDTEDYIPL